MAHTRYRHIRNIGLMPNFSRGGSQADLLNDLYFVGDSLTALGSSTMPAQVMTLYPGRASVLNALGGIDSATILQRLQADNGIHASWITVLWAGRNDVHKAGYAASSGAETINNVASMVALCRGLVRVIEVTPSADGNENVGSALYIARTNVNTTLASTYNSTRVKFVPIVATLQAHGDGGSTDNTDIANGMIPPSLRAVSDATHLNSTGYGYVAQQIYASLGAKP